MRYILIIGALLIAGCSTTPATISYNIAKDVITSEPEAPNEAKVNVVGIGKTEEDAKKDGFKKAIEMSFGSVLLSQEESRNNRLTKNEVDNYTSGYVDDFKIISNEYQSGKYVLNMQVTVKRSAIANRVVNATYDTAHIDGDRAITQQQSIIEATQNYEDLLNTILRDYPFKAITIKYDKTDIKIDDKGKIETTVWVKLRWNQNYNDALMETLEKVSGCKMRPWYMSFKSDPNCNGEKQISASSNKYGYNNFYFHQDTWMKINNSLSRSFDIKVSIYDKGGKLLSTQCNTFNDNLLQAYNNTKEFYINHYFVYTWGVNITDIKGADRVDVSIENYCR